MSFRMHRSWTILRRPLLGACRCEVILWVRLPFWKIAFALFVLLFAAWGYKYLVWE